MHRDDDPRVESLCRELERVVLEAAPSTDLAASFGARVQGRTPQEMAQLHAARVLRHTTGVTAILFFVLASIALSLRARDGMEGPEISGDLVSPGLEGEEPVFGSSGELGLDAELGLGAAFESGETGGFFEEYSSESTIFAALFQEDLIR